MTKEKSNRSIEVPVDKLIVREKMAMQQAKKKRKVGRATKHSILAACGLSLILLGSGFISTGMAAALSNIPLIGPIYKEFGEIASEKIERNQLMTEIEKQDSQNGLTMTVKEAAFDGGRLLVTVVYTGDKELSLADEVVGSSYLTINGQPINPTNGSTGQDDFNSKTIIEHHQYTLGNYDEYGDKIDIAMNGKNLFGYKGKWKVDFPLEKIKAEIHEFNPGVKAETVDGIYAITADKVTFSPLSTRIGVSVDYPVEMDGNDTWPWFDFIVVDDNGNVYDSLKLQMGMVAGNYGHDMVLTLPPMDTIPESFTLKPADTSNEGGFREEIKELELVVPLIEKK